ncbi:NAD-dependent epimerase/dehydratase family protein [Methanosarcina sp. T3]|uniref:NAD-dependent epimerase/dehydratase family protein n=1 Tax=Methanosarcina sp. T3 TaxID=3439062 RepID=UPI003F84D005
MVIKKKKIFLTGGSGFIGTKIVERLIEDNEIVVYDTLQRNSLKNTNILEHPNLDLIKGDVLDFEKLKDSIKGSEIVIHLAAIAGIDTVIKSPTKTMSVNYIGTSNVLKAASELKNIYRFIDFSTSEVYGSYAYKRDESDVTTMGAVGEARWTYSISKLAAEHLTHSYHKEFGLPTISIRPFNIYGPGQIGEGAIHNFIKRAINNEDILIHGDGDQIRSWCYVDDIVDGIILCLENKQGIGQVFNIGNPRATITILSLAEKIKSIAESSSEIIFVPKNYVDVELRIPDIKKSKELLGYSPKIDLNEGLKKTIEWYKKNSYF